MASELMAGFGRADITPALDDPPTFEILDPIFFRALHLRWVGGQVTLLAADLFLLDDRFLQLLAEELSDTDIDTQWILPGACHLGTGPTLFNHYVNQPTQALKEFGNDERYAHAAAEAIRQARADASPAAIAVGGAEAEVGIQYNRRAHDAAGNLRMVSLSEFPTPPKELAYDGVDRQVGVVRIDRDYKRSVALVNFGCHALSLWDRRGNISGDYPGHIAARLKAEGIDALFFQGALGNVHPVRQGEDPCGRIGASLAATVKKVWGRLRPSADVRPRLMQKTITVERQPTLKPDQARSSWEARPPEAEGLARYEYWLAERYRDRMRSTLTLRGIVVGAAALVHIPGEPFVETAVAIRAASSFRQVLLLAHPCPEMGYLPTPQARQEGGDEPLFAPLTDTSEPIIRQAVMDLLAAGWDKTS